ncbi:VWA domain-containing protein [Desulfosporosinus youngiae]|nr:VWA domain-containing protein [Desulfosporosinus youngiae]
MILDRISDEQLYERLLNEFPQWLKEAKLKKILDQ